jgi:PTS system sucrose-specific IIC component
MPTMRPAEARRRSARAADEEHQKVKARQKTGVHSLFRHVGNIFIPIIPGFIACGLILAIANVWKLIAPGVALNPWFLAFAALGSIVVGALNLLVGYNTAKEFGGTPVLGLIAGAVSYMPALAGIPASKAADGTAIATAALVPCSASSPAGRHHRRRRPRGCSR